MSRHISDRGVCCPCPCHHPGGPTTRSATPLVAPRSRRVLPAKSMQASLILPPLFTAKHSSTSRRHAIHHPPPAIPYALFRYNRKPAPTTSSHTFWPCPAGDPRHFPLPSVRGNVYPSGQAGISALQPHAERSKRHKVDEARLHVCRQRAAHDGRVQEARKANWHCAKKRD